MKHEVQTVWGQDASYVPCLLNQGLRQRLDSNCQEAVSSTNMGTSGRTFRLNSFATLICDPARGKNTHLPYAQMRLLQKMVQLNSALRPCLRCRFAAGVQA